MNENEMRNAGTEQNRTQETPIQKREIRPREYGRDPKATHTWNNDWYSEEEVAELRRRYVKTGKDTWEQTTQGKLCLAFYEAFHAYRRYFETHESAKRTPLGYEVDYDEHKLFEEGLRMVEDQKYEREEKLRRNLEKAQKAARCQHEYLSGEGCRAPRMKGKKLCRMHDRLEEAKALKLDLGPMEDADSIQLGIKKLQGAIIDGKLDSKQIGHLAYTIQLAAWNVTRTSMGMREE
jgi:hypothetical protein